MLFYFISQFIYSFNYISKQLVILFKHNDFCENDTILLLVYDVEAKGLTNLMFLTTIESPKYTS